MLTYFQQQVIFKEKEEIIQKLLTFLYSSFLNYICMVELVVIFAYIFLNFSSFARQVIFEFHNFHSASIKSSSLFRRQPHFQCIYSIVLKIHLFQLKSCQNCNTEGRIICKGAKRNQIDQYFFSYVKDSYLMPEINTCYGGHLTIPEYFQLILNILCAFFFPFFQYNDFLTFIKVLKGILSKIIKFCNQSLVSCRENMTISNRGSNFLIKIKLFYLIAEVVRGLSFIVVQDLH